MFRKIAAVLMALMALSLCLCAGAEGVPEDGLYTIGLSSSSDMFRVVKCVLRVEDGRMTAVLTMSGTGYGYLFSGTSAAADAAPVEEWIPCVLDAEDRHTFAVESPALDEDMDVAAWSIRYSKWYDRTLRFFSDTLSDYAEIAPDGVYSGILRSDTGLDGAPCRLTSKGGAMVVEVEQQDMALRLDGADAASSDGVLQFALASLDKKLPVSVCTGGEWSDGWLKIESGALESALVSVADGVYSIEVIPDSSLLKFADCMLTVRDGQMTALLVTRNDSFAYFFQGLAKDAADNEALWIPAAVNADGTATYVMPVETLDRELPLATYSAKKKMWYDRTVTFDSDTLVPIR